MTVIQNVSILESGIFERSRLIIIFLASEVTDFDGEENEPVDEHNSSK